MLAEKTIPNSGNASPRIKLLQVLRRRLWAILLVAGVLTGSAVAFSTLQTPIYEASVKILIGREYTTQTNTSLNAEVQGLQELTKTMAKAVDTVPVAEAVGEKLDLSTNSAGKLRSSLSAKQDPGTMFIDLTYKDSDPERAQLIANTFGQVFSEQVSNVSVGSNAVITAAVWQQASLPRTPVSPDPVRNGLLALVLGILLGVGLAFLLEYRDDSLNSPEEVERVSGVPTFGMIPKFQALANK